LHHSRLNAKCSDWLRRYFIQITFAGDSDNSKIHPSIALQCGRSFPAFRPIHCGNFDGNWHDFSKDDKAAFRYDGVIQKFMTRLIRFSLLLLLGWMVIPIHAAIRIVHTNYHGWNDAILLNNGLVEVVVVPSVNRVMQFRFIGDADGPFWENRQLDGFRPDPEDKSWRNFGGDKSWPAPQSEWPQIMDRAWPPPRAFDPSSSTATIHGTTLVLVSAVDPFFKMRAIRRIQLDRHRPVMRIETQIEQVGPSTRKTGVWVVTQLKHPQRLYMPVPEKSLFAGGYCPMGDMPADLKVENGLISMTRSSVRSCKIGSDASTVLWMGERTALRIDSPRVRKADYPDKGCSAEIYTNPDPAYIELELLGPLNQIRTGRKIGRTSTYTLYRLGGKSGAVEFDLEARKILHP